MIIDAHVHIWDLARSGYEWLKNADGLLQQTYSLEQLEASRVAAGVDAGLLVQADNTLEDTALMIEAANSHDWIKGVVGWLPLTSSSKTEQLLQSVFSTEKYFKGVRHLIHDEADDEWLLQPEVIKSLKLVAAHHLPFDVVGVKVSHIKTALRVAELVPDLKMVFDHLNQPPVKSGDRFGEWGQYMKLAAQHKNFYVKISGLGITAGKEKFSAAVIKPYIDFILTGFGAPRCFCGGDWPVSLLASGYVEAWDVYKQVIKELVGDEYQRRLIFSENAISFYNLDRV
ncbi:MAG: amidohydrolase family protein [Niabella sp.]